MKILFVAPYPLSPIRIRSYGFVSQLAKLHDITVLMLCSNVHEIETQPRLMEGATFISVVDKRQYKIIRSIKALFTKQPLQVAYDASPALRDAIMQQLGCGHFDLLHVEFIRALGALPDPLPIPAIWDAVDCISRLYAYAAQSGVTPLLRLIGGLEARRTRAYEYTQLTRFPNVLVTSERDRQALLNIEGRPAHAAEKQRAEITVLAHGVDQDYFQPYRGKRHAETFVFSGKMSFHANIAGVLHLVKHIMPLIWQRRPRVRLVIVGSRPPASIQRLAQDARIEVTGYVPDMRPYIEQVRVAVCPLPYAVGIQNKILEAMALGTPVVASSHAAAGLLASSGQDLLVADEPEDFAACVLQLLDDQEAWNRLSESALAYIARQHNWGQIVQKLTTIYTKAVNNTR